VTSNKGGTRVDANFSASSLNCSGNVPDPVGRSNFFVLGTAGQCAGF
jgi:hypothetical protein